MVQNFPVQTRNRFEPAPGHLGQAREDQGGETSISMNNSDAIR